MLLAAVDDRIQFSAPANMMSFIMQGGRLCENAPNLRLGTYNVEIASMMAPRPMIMASATGDWTRNMMKEEFPAVRAIYELYGKGGNVETVRSRTRRTTTTSRIARPCTRSSASTCWATPTRRNYRERSIQRRETAGHVGAAQSQAAG